MTTTSRVPNLSAANSTLPTWDGATTLPATRMTKRSPNPWLKTSSAGDAGVRTTEDDRERLLPSDQRGTTGLIRKRSRGRLILREAPVPIAKVSQCLNRSDHDGNTQARLLDPCPVLDEKLLQDRTVAAVFLFAVAAHREVSRVR